MAHILSIVPLPFTSPLFPAQRGCEYDFSDVMLFSRVLDVQLPDKQAAAMTMRIAAQSIFTTPNLNVFCKNRFLKDSMNAQTQDVQRFREAPASTSDNMLEVHDVQSWLCDQLSATELLKCRMSGTPGVIRSRRKSD